MRILGMLIMMVLVVGCEICYGQKCESHLDSISNRILYSNSDVEVQSSIIGGFQKLYDDIGRQISLPDNFTSNKVIISFIIETDGTLTYRSTVKNIEGSNLDSSIFNIAKKYKWYSGECNGMKVPTMVQLVTVIDPG